MEKYLVKVFDVFATFFDIEADSKEDAKKKVLEQLSERESLRQESFYETTLEPELWQVLSHEEISKHQEDFKEKYEQYLKNKQ